MKSLNPNRGLKPNSLNNDETCRASVENKKLALLEDQVDKLQIDLDILAKEVKDFGSSFNTASAYITKLEANNATIKETLTAKNLTSENTSTKAIIKQFQQKNASASCIVGQSAKKEADLDIVVIKNGISQYVKLHLNGTTVISQGAGADYITDFRVYENGTAEILFSDTADIMVYSESSDFTAFKGTTSGPYKSIPVNNEITLSGKLNIDNEEVVSFNNVDIKSLTVNELTSLDLINAVRLSATELHADAATILDATIEVLKAQQIDTTELHATNGVVDTLNVTNLNVDATCSAGDINSSGTIKAEAFEALKGIRAEDIKMDKKLQLPVITNTDYTDIEMPVKSGMVFGMIIDEATKECLASFTLIKNTTKFSNVLFCYSQKELHNILSVHEDEDKDFILRTKLSGKTLVYGVTSNEDLRPFEAVVNSARPMKINHDITYLQHTLIMGDKSLAFGLEIDGELKAALIPLPGTSAFNDIVISNTLAVGKEVNFGTEALDAVFNMYGISTFNGAVNIDGKTTIGASDKPQDLEVNGSTTLNGITVIDGNTSIGSDTAPADLTVTGNIYQKGDAYETHVQQLKTTKDWIITRQPEKADDPTPPLAPGEMSGIKAIAYDDEGNNGILGFDKTGTARVGDEGKEQAIATRAEEAEMVNGNIVAWNGTDKKLVTPKAAIVDGHTLAKTDDALMLYGSEGMDNIPEGSLDTVVKCGQYSADDGLANKITEKPAGETGAFDLIVGYFNSDDALPYQIYTSKGKQKAYYRMTVDGMYGEWKQLASKAEVDSLIKSAVDAEAKARADADTAIINGTTGLTNAATNKALNALDTGSSTPGDNDYYISQYAHGGTTTTTYHRRPVKALWEYMKSKISSVLGLTKDSYGGTANNASQLGGVEADKWAKKIDLGVSIRPDSVYLRGTNDDNIATIEDTNGNALKEGIYIFTAEYSFIKSGRQLFIAIVNGFEKPYITSNNVIYGGTSINTHIGVNRSVNALVMGYRLY